MDNSNSDPNEGRAAIRIPPNCGLVAVASAAGVSVDLVEAYIRTAYRKPPQWKGRTTRSQRLAALDSFKARFFLYGPGALGTDLATFCRYADRQGENIPRRRYRPLCHNSRRDRFRPVRILPDRRP